MTIKKNSIVGYILCITHALCFQDYCHAMKPETFSSNDTDNNQFTLRQANAEDCNELHNIYDNFTQDDRQKVVVYPKKVRFKKLLDIVTRFFVATCNNKIIAFIKMYICLDEKERDAILKSELSLLGGEILKEAHNTINLEDLYGNITEKELDTLDTFPKFPTENQCFVYYGGAYTNPDYRDKKINSKLQRYALKNISQNFPTTSTLLCLLYGQVEANANQRGMLRVFAEFIGKEHKPKNKEITYKIRQCLAYKPELTIKDEKIVPIFTKQEEGRGTIAIFSLSSNNENEK